MKWSDIKLLSLQKMDLADGNTIEINDSTSPYISKMWGAANECMNMLATAGKYIPKKYEINQYPIPNLLENTLREFQHLTDENFVSKGKSYYFEANGVGTVYIEKFTGEWIIQKTISLTKGYKKYRGLITNTDQSLVRIRFSGDFLYTYRNVAMYEYSFPTENDVPEYSQERRYELNKLMGDFYMLTPNFLSKYEGEVKYRQEGPYTIVLDSFESGTWYVEYYAYPNVFGPTTPDTTEIELDQESASLLPLYIASQLFKDDDISRAVTWRNEFEVAFERLTNNFAAPKSKVKGGKYGFI